MTTELDPRHALVLFSGGQDSTTCLAWALQRFAGVETVGFDYGQRHAVELQCRTRVLQELRMAWPGWGVRLGEDHLLDLKLLGQISDTALTAERAITFSDGGLPDTFVPARNLLFLGFAAAVAYRRGQQVLVGGMCETDYSGYPDCRRDTLDATERALNLGAGSGRQRHRYKAQRGDQRRHGDGPQPGEGTAENGVHLLVSLRDQLLDVGQHHKAVEHGDAGESDEADGGGHRERHAAQP